MTDSLKAQIKQDSEQALRAHDKQRVGALRLIMSAIKQKEVDERIDLAKDDAAVLQVLEKMLKQRQDSLEQYQKANRTDLATQEQFEIDLIKSYMPAPLAQAELDQLIKEAIAAAGAQSMKDMGKVMAILKPRIQGRADMRVVSERIKQGLGG